MRRLQGTPPYRDLLALTVSGLDEGQVIRACRYGKQRLGSLLADQPELSLLGPTPLAVVRVNLRYRYRVNIGCRNNSSVRAAIAQVITEISTDKRFKGVSVFGDNDPSD